MNFKKALLVATTSFTLSGLLCAVYSNSDPRSCNWVFVSSGNIQLKGSSLLSEIEAGCRPWNSMTSNQTGRLTVRLNPGQVIKELPLKNGVCHGTARSWYANGQLMQELEYINGTKHGHLVLWSRDGQRERVATYQNDLLHGESVSWHTNGQIRSIIEFSNGKMNGMTKRWDELGNVIEDGVYRQMQPWNGRLVILKKRGEAPLIGIYTNGVLLKMLPTSTESGRGAGTP